MPRTKSATLNLRIAPEIKAAAEKAAADDRRSLTSLVEKLLIAHLKDSGRAQYVGATDDEALAAFQLLAEKEGILCAFESAHALAGARRHARIHPGQRILVGLSGRGDKDMPTLQKTLLASGKP